MFQEHPLVLTWFIGYICNRNLQFLTHVIIITPPSDIFDLNRFWLSCLGPLFFLLPKANTFKLFGFETFWLREYLMNVILETCHAH